MSITPRSPSESAHPTFTVRSPLDALAVVPIVLGFHPESSLVMLTFGGARNVNARVDLPAPGATDAEIASLVSTLVTPAIDQGAEATFFVFYSADRVTCRRLHRVLVAACRRAQIRMLDTLRVHDGSWWSVSAPASAPGHAYVAQNHPFQAEAVVAGMVTLTSRDEVAARVAADPEGAARVEATGVIGPRLDVEEARALIEAHCDGLGRLGDDEAAWLIASLADPEVRDACWWRLTAARARDRLDLWCDLLRRTPGDHVTHVAGVTAMLAWLTGDGALAWCAVDRADEDGRPSASSLVGLVRAMLERGAPPLGPDDWEALEAEAS